MYIEELWKSSVPEKNHKTTRDGSDLGVIDPHSIHYFNTFPQVKFTELMTLHSQGVMIFFGRVKILHL